MRELKLKKDRQRYRLHYLIKRREESDYANLDTRKRVFSQAPDGKLSKILVNRFQYPIQTNIV